MLPYTADKPTHAETSDQLRARIPGWGADLDPKDRPSVPKERFDPAASGAHWTFPERQKEKQPRERSIEHRQLTPVFGTTIPTRGLSGALRRLSYARYGEGRGAHWVILVAADRIDAVESHLRSFGTANPDDPIAQSGVLSERRRHGFSSRFGRGRADLKHGWLDPLIILGPWLIAGVVAVKVSGMLLHRR